MTLLHDIHKILTTIKGRTLLKYPATKNSNKHKPNFLKLHQTLKTAI